MTRRPPGSALPQSSGFGAAISHGNTEFSGAQTRFCAALDAGMPCEVAERMSGLERVELIGLYHRWQRRKAMQL